MTANAAHHWTECRCLIGESHDVPPDIGSVPVEPPDLDVLAGFLSTIDFKPSQHHPDTMRPIAAELLRLAGYEVTE